MVHSTFWCDGWPECADNHADELICNYYNFFDTADTVDELVSICWSFYKQVTLRVQGTSFSVQTEDVLMKPMYVMDNAIACQVSMKIVPMR